jgi:SAM-dependent methyltransferase
MSKQQRIAEPQQGAITGPENVRRYAQEAESWTIMYREFLRELKSLGLRGRYLEVGSGPGVLASIIAQDNPDVQITAVELSPDMVAFAREYVTGKGLQERIQFVVGDATDGELIGSLGEFDLVYSTLSMHHWQHPEKAIRNFTNVVADGGAILIYDLRRVWWLRWIPARGGFLDSVRASYLEPEIREMLQSLGVGSFEVREVFPFMQLIVIRNGKDHPPR